MVLSEGLSVGSAGGHGPVRYWVHRYEPGRLVVFRFTRPRGWRGTHRFVANALPDGEARLMHVLEMDTTGTGLLLWVLVFRPLHDALIEEALDRVSAELGYEPPRARVWTVRVRLLRRLLGSRHDRRGSRGALQPDTDRADRMMGDPGPRKESLLSRLARWRFNQFPAYRATGARVTFIAADWSEVHLRLPLNRRTRNYVGTTFGGSMYAAVDPVYMVMLIQRLGADYTVWDKAASIRFRIPGKDALYARFTIDDGEVARIRSLLRCASSVDRDYQVELVDREGQIHATVHKTLHIRSRLTGRAEDQKGEHPR